MVFLQLKYSCLSLYFCDLGSLAANIFVFYELRIGLPEGYFISCLQRDSMESVVDVVSDHLAFVNFGSYGIIFEYLVLTVGGGSYYSSPRFLRTNWNPKRCLIPGPQRDGHPKSLHPCPFAVLTAECLRGALSSW